MDLAACCDGDAVTRTSVRQSSRLVISGNEKYRGIALCAGALFINRANIKTNMTGGRSSAKLKTENSQPEETGGQAWA